MQKKTKNTLIGVGIGAAAGSILGALKASTVMFPGVWIPAAAYSMGYASYHMSGGNGFATGAGVVVGATYGTLCLAAYPLTAPLALAEASTMPLVGATIGGVAGYCHE